MLEQNRTLEYIGLARNGIRSAEPLTDILNAIGRKPMSAEELEAYRNKEKDREAIIEKNKKAKAKRQAEEPVPYLDPIEQSEDGRWYILRNQKLKILNLAMNLLDKNSRERLESFVSETSEGFQLVLKENEFDDKTKEFFKRRHPQKVFI
eukprot:TRINITY_DN10263_c0_g1_i4.p2 TRINITY_DN10263_c0_g1~~TRINITY_DN10263_c0_g1_i4.p2  ORF type:complete len:150 (-),score=44.70 TRINITY_DN10263_c0_g1_i4:37-486(-)